MRVAFVVQRYHESLGGGSEFLCRAVAQKLSKYFDLEVLTTCASDYMTWNNHYEPGVERDRSVTVRRFRVDFPRNVNFFNRFSNRLYGSMRPPNEVEPDLEAQRKWAREQGPYSSEFLRYLDENADRYDVFVFFTYLYGLTFFGLPKVAKKSILVPTAHDEPSFHMAVFREIFKAPRALLYCTPEEQTLVRESMGYNGASAIAGIGMHLEAYEASGKAPVDQDYLTYVGRIDESKGCREMFDFFIRFKQSHPALERLKLRVAGRAVMDIPQHPDIESLGFVSDEAKVQLIRGARVFLMPSPFESLSISLLEAFACRVPTLSNFRCEVLRGQTERSGSGLGYKNYAEFEEGLLKLLSPDYPRAQAVQRGYEFVQNNYTWEAMEKIYCDLIQEVAAR